MLTRSSVIYVLPKLLLLALLLGTFGCSSATYIQAKVADNPLDRVAQQAQENWSVERVDANTLHLSDFWPIHSCYVFGYSASHANLFYATSDSVLHIQYYLQVNQLLLLFIPIYLNAEASGVGAEFLGFESTLRLIMNDQIYNILQWSGARVLSRRDVNESEQFPPKSTTESPPN